MVGVSKASRERARQKCGPWLTPREKQVLRLLGQGKWVSEIGTATGISTKTVQTHQARLKRKLGASNLFELILFAVRSNPRPRLICCVITGALSQRERQVFGMLGEGMRTNEIAQRLGVSERTVYTWFGRIKAKGRIDNFNRLVWLACLWREKRLVLQKHEEWRYR